MGRPLSAKLGITPGRRVALLGAPEGFEPLLEPLPPTVHLRRQLRGAPFDVILAFAPRARDLRARFPRAQAKLREAGGLWVVFYKKSSGKVTDLEGPAVRAYGLSRGLVDNKICAVDEDWSALRFVRRLADRGGRR